MMVDFFLETMQAGRQWRNISKVLKVKCIRLKLFTSENIFQKLFLVIILLVVILILLF